eukprot:5023491-Amphidinium_carterae.1
MTVGIKAEGVTEWEPEPGGEGSHFGPHCNARGSQSQENRRDSCECPVLFFIDAASESEGHHWGIVLIDE